MASLSKLAEAKGKTIERIISQIKIQNIHYKKLHPSSRNFYNQDKIEELADAIEMAGMILEPILVVKTDMSEYEVIAGHRRRLANNYLVESKGLKKFEFVPCIVITPEMAQLDGIAPEEKESVIEAYIQYLLISSNSTNRELTDYEKMEQAMQLREIIPVLRNKGLKGRELRQEIANEINKSTGLVGTYEAIHNNLIGEGLELFREQKIGISVAAGLASLTEAEQVELLQKEDLSTRDIEDYKTTKSVSESDTGKATSDLVTTGSKSIKMMTILPQQEKYIQEAVENVFGLFQNDSFDSATKDKLITILAKRESVGNAYVDLERVMLDKVPYKNKRIKLYRTDLYIVEYIGKNTMIQIPTHLFWRNFYDIYTNQILEVRRKLREQEDNDVAADEVMYQEEYQEMKDDGHSIYDEIDEDEDNDEEYGEDTYTISQFVNAIWLVRDDARQALESGNKDLLEEMIKSEI